MTEEIHEIERLIKQSGELADSLIRLAQKLKEHHQRLLHEIDNEQTSPHQEAYVTVRRMVANGTITPQEAAVKLLAGLGLLSLLALGVTLEAINDPEQLT